MQLKVVFEPSDDGGYTVYVPSLPACVSEGDTLDEARRNILEILEPIELYLESEDGDDKETAGAKLVIVEELTV